jgi:flavin-dependent dehydrogenase
MKMTLSTSEAADILFNDKNANWSYAGARALAEYLEEYEESTGEEMELDYVAIRCDFSEWDSLQDWAGDYFGTDRDGHSWKYHLDINEEMDNEQIDDLVREYIQDRGQLIEFDGGVIVSSF